MNPFVFQVTAAGSHCVSVYQKSNCVYISEVDWISNDGHGSCSDIDVNTGTDVKSYKCSPNDICDEPASSEMPVEMNLKLEALGNTSAVLSKSTILPCLKP